MPSIRDPLYSVEMCKNRSQQNHTHHLGRLQSIMKHLNLSPLKSNNFKIQVQENTLVCLFGNVTNGSVLSQKKATLKLSRSSRHFKGVLRIFPLRAKTAR